MLVATLVVWVLLVLIIVSAAAVRDAHDRQAGNRR